MMLGLNKAKKVKRQRTAFTLLEVMFAAVLIGLVIASIAAASSAFTIANGYGVDMSTAEFLIEEIRELTSLWPFDHVMAIPPDPVNPPVDSTGQVMNEFAAFSQVVTLQRVLATDFTQIDHSNGDFARITVTVTKNGAPISSTSWIRARLQ